MPAAILRAAGDHKDNAIRHRERERRDDQGLWNRLSEARREAGLESHARVAAEFHSMIAFMWLLGFAHEAQVDEVAYFVAALRLAGPFVAMASIGFDYC
jgi:hypothetical protein